MSVRDETFGMSEAYRRDIDVETILALEYAVINAAIRLNELGGYCDYDSETVNAESDLMTTVDALLKARKEK